MVKSICIYGGNLGVRKIMLASLSVVLCVGLSACADSGNSSGTTQTTSKKISATTTTTLTTTEAVSKQLIDDPTTGTTVLDINDANEIISDDSKKIIFGEWVITQQLIIDKETFDEKTAKNLLKGKRLSFSENLAKFENIECKNPVYKEIVYSNYDFFEKSRVELRIFGMRDLTITAVDIYEPTDPPTIWKCAGSHLLVKDSNTLILASQGQYYVLERAQ
jgi:hypothetical protein